MAGGYQFRKGRKLERLERKVADPQEALKQIGALMVAESQRSFKLQQFGNKKWDARAPINVYGIIADFADGKRTPPNRRFESRPALRDTGRLASSIAFVVKGNTVEVGTNLDYASVHNFGGEIESKTITKDVQSLLSAWLQRKGKEMRSRLGWLLSPERTGTKLKGEVSARRFVGITPKTIKDVKRAIGVHIMEVK
jgi:phage gpG-like protein